MADGGNCYEEKQDRLNNTSDGREQTSQGGPGWEVPLEADEKGESTKDGYYLRDSWLGKGPGPEAALVLTPTQKVRTAAFPSCFFLTLCFSFSISPLPSFSSSLPPLIFLPGTATLPALSWRKPELVRKCYIFEQLGKVARKYVSVSDTQSRCSHRGAC